MNFYTLNLVQGSPEWAAHRARPQVCNASELVVAMGISKKMRRDDLVKSKATGIAIEHGDFVEEVIFAGGHEFEAIARPWAEEIGGEDLYSATFCAEVDGLILSASLDGHPLLCEFNWEHKQLNADLAASLDVGIIPDEYHPQMEQGLLCNPDAYRCLFMASNGNKETMRWAWYESNPELRAKIIPTWKQFWADVAAYVPANTEPAPTGKAPEALPALYIAIQGGVTASNLPEFKAVALGAIAAVNRDLRTDQDFADAEKSVKWCAEIESRIKAAKEHAMSQTASIDELFRALTEISDEAKRVRLDLDKLVKSRKETIKGEIVAGGVAAFAAHVRDLNAAMPAAYMPQVPTDFGGCIKSLRTVDSIRNAVNSELARAKIAAGEIATRIHANVAAIKESGLVVPDTAALVLKSPDDLAAVLAQRAAAEQAKEEAQRARILAQEQARLEAEALAKVQVEADRIASEKAAAAPAVTDLTAVEKAFEDYFKTGTGIATTTGPDLVGTVALPEGDGMLLGTITLIGEYKPAQASPAVDAVPRLTLGQINERLAPISLSVDCLSQLGFDPVERVKASRFYLVSDLPAIARAIARHVIDATS